MRLLSYRREDGSESVGVWSDELNGPYDLIRAMEVYMAMSNCSPVMVLDMLDLLDAGLVRVEFLGAIDDYFKSHGLINDLSDADDYRILAPIARPRAIYALGRNYPAHAREQGADVPEEPIVFYKAPTAVIGPEEDVIYKSWFTRVDPEAELAVVIGGTGSDITEEDALSHVAGYTALNDVTERDLQSKDIGNSHPWFRSKSIDTFCPMGPFITLRDEIPDPGALDVTMRVNGEVRQQDNTRGLTFSVPFLISWISRYHTLYPGDVISTGTPEGIQPVYPGDEMEVEVEGVGVLKNRVVAEDSLSS